MEGNHMKPINPVSPKVYATGAGGVALFVLVAVLSAVDQNMLAFAGEYAPLIYVGVTALVAVIAGYLKLDPQRIDVGDGALPDGGPFSDTQGAFDEEYDNPDELEDDGNGDTVADPEVDGR